MENRFAFTLRNNEDTHHPGDEGLTEKARRNLARAIKMSKEQRASGELVAAPDERWSTHLGVTQRFEVLAARLSSGLCRLPAYRHGANYRSYKPSTISRATQSRSDAYSTDPLGSAREAERCDNNQRNKPTYDQQGYMSAAGPASVSRTTCPLNIHEPPSYAPRKPRRGGERDVAVLGRNGLL